MVQPKHVLDGGAKMKTFYVEVHYRLRDADRKTLDTHVEKMLDVLDEEPGLIDPDLGVNYKKHTVDVCTLVEAENAGDAVNLALTGVRSVVHRVGDSTPGWERSDEEILASTVQLADMVDA